MSRRLLFVLGALVLCACNRNGVEPERASAAALTTAASFGFLPPLAAQPATQGPLDASLSPEVRITDGSGAILSRFTTGGSGAQQVRVDADCNCFLVNWPTGDGEGARRIHVLQGQVEMGALDVFLTTPKKGAPAGVVALAAGRTVPIKFFANACAPVTCAASDQCHLAGVCDPATGACSNPPTPDQTACDDGNGCTRDDQCLAGVCTGGAGCSAEATCQGSGASASCACKTGFAGDGYSCADVDECLAANGGCDPLTTCTNTVGSFACGPCPSGYTGTGASGCRDIDECLLANGGCDPLTTCINTAGSFECGPCPAGYDGTGLTGCVPSVTCTPACTGDKLCTADGCRSPLLDPANCGTPGNACAGGQICCAGTCSDAGACSFSVLASEASVFTSAAVPAPCLAFWADGTLLASSSGGVSASAQIDASGNVSATPPLGSRPSIWIDDSGASRLRAGGYENRHAYDESGAKLWDEVALGCCDFSVSPMAVDFASGFLLETANGQFFKHDAAAGGFLAHSYGGSLGGGMSATNQMRGNLFYGTGFAGGAARIDAYTTDGTFLCGLSTGAGNFSPGAIFTDDSITASNSGGFVARASSGCALLWSVPAGSPTPPVLAANGDALVGSLDASGHAQLSRLAAADGSAVWTMPAAGAVRDLLVGDDGFLYAVLATSAGAEVWAVGLDAGSPVRKYTGLAAAGEMLLRQGVLYLDGGSQGILTLRVPAGAYQGPWPVVFHDNQRTANAAMPLSY